MEGALKKEKNVGCHDVTRDDPAGKRSNESLIEHDFLISPDHATSPKYELEKNFFIYMIPGKQYLTLPAGSRQGLPLAPATGCESPNGA